MQTKLESLSLSKFNSSVFKGAENILGGANCSVSDGGATCSTGGGSNNNWTWDSDTDTYDGNGVRDGRDYHGGVRNTPAQGGTTNSGL